MRLLLTMVLYIPAVLTLSYIHLLLFYAHRDYYMFYSLPSDLAARHSNIEPRAYHVDSSHSKQSTEIVLRSQRFEVARVCYHC